MKERLEYEFGNHHLAQMFRMATMGYIGPPMAFLCLDKIKKEEKLKHGELILSFVTEVSKFMQAGYAIRYCS